MVDRQISDTVLLERFHKGDERSLEAIFERHRPRAFQYALHLTRDRDKAGDIVAEAFARVCRSAQSFKGQSAFGTWLHRILTNCFLDSRKKTDRHPCESLDDRWASDDGLNEIQVQALDESPHDLAIRSLRESSMQSAVRGLSDYQRSIITMFHAEQLSYGEIADRLSVPLGTVKSRLNRARIALNKALEPDRELYGVEAILSA